MTTNVIQAEYEQLNDIAARFGQHAENNTAMITLVRQGVTNLQRDWEGKGAAAFFAEMEKEIFPALQRLTGALEQARTETLQISNIMQAAEEEAAAPFRGGAGGKLLSLAQATTMGGPDDPPIKDKLNKAMEGWGADSKTILDLTAKATDAEKQEILNDAALMTRLASELSREDMLQVLNNLNAPIKDKLNAAMSGWGADEDAIRDLITNASDEEKAALLNDQEFLRQMMNELSWNEFAKNVERLGRVAPDAAALSANPTVQAALASAWTDSDPAVPGPGTNQHEEGGWIYLNLVTGDISIVRQTAGGQAAIDLSNPPTVDESIVIGKFHTHPNLGPGWVPGPSPGDINVDAQHGVPDLIRADGGDFTSGPNQRLHLAGDQGLPGAAGGIAPQAKEDGSYDEQQTP